MCIKARGALLWIVRFSPYPLPMLTRSKPMPLPLGPAEVAARGWVAVDVVFVSGDAYVDHPSFAAATRPAQAATASVWNG